LKIKPYNSGGALITVYNEYATISENVYLIKDSASNSGRSFTVGCNEFYEEISLGSRYTYYAFDYIIDADGYESKNNTEGYGGVSYNISIDVNYTTVNYDVNFISVVKQSDGTLKPAELEALDSIKLGHGTDKVIDSSSENTRYLLLFSS
jgi:hypothetical protein